MPEGFMETGPVSAPRVWAVGALVRAVADALQSRFNPLTVRGEVSGFSRAASGHCYFSIKDDAGQLRCALFRRAAEQLDFAPRDGLRVEAFGKLDVYGPRGDLQFIVERLQPAGQGALFEQFLQLKAQLEAEGLFDPGRKRSLPAQPASIGVVTSLGAAALRDVASVLRRRTPHLPVVIYPSAVQGAQAPAELCAALETAYQRHQASGESAVLLLVRGGGSLEDLWAFNDAQLVRTLARAPMPVVCGVGHETDFTLADFVADLRAPTPTAAAELCAPSADMLRADLLQWQERLARAGFAGIDMRAQRLDWLAGRLGRPSMWLQQNREVLMRWQLRLHRALLLRRQALQQRLLDLQGEWPQAVERQRQRQRQRLQDAETALHLLDPRWVLQRGYAMLADEQGRVVSSVQQAAPGQALRATLADGTLDVSVRGGTGQRP